MLCPSSIRHDVRLAPLAPFKLAEEVSHGCVGIRHCEREPIGFAARRQGHRHRIASNFDAGRAVSKNDTHQIHPQKTFKKWLPLRYPEHTTDLQTFGVKPVIEIREGQHRIRVDRISGSLATYSDGVSRRWQGHSESVSTVRPELVPALKRWSAQSP